MANIHAAASAARAAARDPVAAPSRRSACRRAVLRTSCGNAFYLKVSVCLAVLAAAAIARPESAARLAGWCAAALRWCADHPEKVLYRLYRELRLERLLVTAAMTYFTTKLASRFTSEGQIMREYEQRVSLQVNFITQDASTGTLEMDWVVVSEEPLPASTQFRNMLSRARKRRPALPDELPTLCPLNVRGLLPGKLSDQMMWNTLKSYASARLINNLGVSHLLAGMPIKVTDVVIVLTFERDENVGVNPLGRKMRLLAISRTDLEAVRGNDLNVKAGKAPFLRTRTGTKWSAMRLGQLEELARHVHDQPLSDRRCDSTRCFGVVRLYVPVHTAQGVQHLSQRMGLGDAAAAATSAEPAALGPGQPADASSARTFIRQMSRPAWHAIQQRTDVSYYDSDGMARKSPVEASLVF